jgi:6,7-dimethyl-8-ribityllumazine synthase
VTTFEGTPAGDGRRVAIVAGRFNEVVTTRLVEGAVDGLHHQGVAPDDVDVAWVPGAFEIPLVAQRLARSGDYDAVVCLGAVIRGDTAHFELVAGEAARGIGEAARLTGVPVIFEVLATDDLEQARARAGGAPGNKGWQAAQAALTMASLMDTLPKEADR